MHTSQKEYCAASQAEGHDRRSLVLLHIVLVAPESVARPIVIDQGYLRIPLCCCTPDRTHQFAGMPPPVLRWGRRQSGLDVIML